MNKDEYFISFHSYGTMVRATNTDDAIIVAKSNAIQKGYERPKLVSVKLSDGLINYYCRACGVEQVKIKESVCSKCPQELGYLDGNEKGGVEHKPITPQNSHKNGTKTQPLKPLTFEEFLKENGGKWETIDSHFSFDSLESYKEAELQLDKQNQDGEGHIMNVSFGDVFDENHLDFHIEFGLEQKGIHIAKGKIWEEQRFPTMKEAFHFMRKIAHQYFQLVL